MHCPAIARHAGGGRSDPWLTRLGNQQVKYVVALTEPVLVFDGESSPAQQIDDLDNRAELEIVLSERPTCHGIGVVKTYDDSARTLGHSGKLGEGEGQLGDEVDGVQGDGTIE
jgi:hypothetical protein